jgi:hypothetical protein
MRVTAVTLITFFLFARAEGRTYDCLDDDDWGE